MNNKVLRELSPCLCGFACIFYEKWWVMLFNVLHEKIAVVLVED
jgi:hypothetical protein